LLQRSDSLSSNASSLIDDTVRKLQMSTAGRTNLKQQLYNDDIDESKVRDYFISFSSR
jgi:hypothetical protein